MLLVPGEYACHFIIDSRPTALQPVLLVLRQCLLVMLQLVCACAARSLIVLEETQEATTRGLLMRN